MFQESLEFPFEKSKQYRIIIAGGGTGGHVLAGIALADAAKKKWQLSNENFLFIGTEGRIEEKLVPQSGYRLKTLRIGSLNRVSWRMRLKTCFLLPKALWDSFLAIYKENPQWVIGVGGYSSGTVLLASWFLKRFFLKKIFISVLEQNAVLGLTNRWLSRFVDRIFTAFQMDFSFSSSLPIHLVGNPIRSQFQPLPASRFDRSTAQNKPFTILVLGGSQGSVALNNLILSTLEELKDLKETLYWIHQTGTLDVSRVKEQYQSQSWKGEVKAFIQEIKAAYEVAHLIICRAGSSTLSEIAAVGRASILIPLPTAANQHQEKNAHIFSNRRAALCLNQWETNSKELAKLIRGFYNDPLKINEIEKNVKSFYRPTAAADLWNLWEQLETKRGEKNVT